MTGFERALVKVLAEHLKAVKALQPMLEVKDVIKSKQRQADLRQLVGGLVAATRAMEQRTKSLEGELHATSQQVNDLLRAKRVTFLPKPAGAIEITHALRRVLDAV